MEAFGIGSFHNFSLFPEFIQPMQVWRGETCRWSTQAMSDKPHCQCCPIGGQGALVLKLALMM